jgi:hypothetical protein
MKFITRLLVSCFITSLLLTSSAAFADRPSMSDREPMPPPVPETIAEPDNVVDETATTVVEQVMGDAIDVQPGETLPVNLLDFPRRGMSMDKVQNELGRPIQISPAVGTPPITTWMYDDRNVYFEYSKVVHVVATK